MDVYFIVVYTGMTNFIIGIVDLKKYMVPMFNEIILCKSQYFIFKSRDYEVKCQNCPTGYPNCDKNLNFKCFNCKLHHMGRFVTFRNYVLF